MPYYISIPPETGGGTTVVVSGGTPYVTGVTVTPANTSSGGGTVQYYASCTFSGTNGLVTGALPNSFLSWSSSNTAVVTVTQAGLATWVSGTGGGTVAFISAALLGDVLGVANLTATAVVGAIPIIANQGTMVANAYISVSGGMSDAVGYTWGRTAAAPTIKNWSANTAAGVGSWSGSDSVFFSGSNTSIFPAGNFMMTIVGWELTNMAGGCIWTSTDNAYYHYTNGGTWQLHTAVDTSTSSGVPGAAPAFVCVSFGRDGTNQYIKINRGTKASAAKGSPVAKNIKIANGTAGGQLWNGVIYNVWVSSDAWNDTIINANHETGLTFFGV